MTAANERYKLNKELAQMLKGGVIMDVTPPEQAHIAEEAGAVISFDPNLRPPLWESLDEAREQVLYGLGHCQILKISDNEIQWLTGEEDYTAGVNWIRFH